MSWRQRWMLWALLIILLFAFAPVLSVFVSSGIASMAGCALNEGGTNPCVIAGIDAGGFLAGLFVVGWLALATVPIGAVALLIWVVVAVVFYLRRRTPPGSIGEG